MTGIIAAVLYRLKLILVALHQLGGCGVHGEQVSTVRQAGVDFSSVNLVHVLPRPRMMPSLLGMATSNGRAESTGSRHGNGRALP